LRSKSPKTNAVRNKLVPNATTTASQHKTQSSANTQLHKQTEAFQDNRQVASSHGKILNNQPALSVAQLGTGPSSPAPQSAAQIAAQKLSEAQNAAAKYHSAIDTAKENSTQQRGVLIAKIERLVSNLLNTEQASIKKDAEDVFTGDWIRDLEQRGVNLDKATDINRYMMALAEWRMATL